ncbi:hypothetical protein K0M31_013700 [Melipona bicolor]|uniref:Uncharacterized protein n=1 Tax=Melipona bicolor TaxID=60889 RepID=A0AA40KG83_9HYME|nr:hypothetical protein K0M31_013700 [Melipona bicolor]
MIFRVTELLQYPANRKSQNALFDGVGYRRRATNDVYLNGESVGETKKNVAEINREDLRSDLSPRPSHAAAGSTRYPPGVGCISSGGKIRAFTRDGRACTCASESRKRRVSQRKPTTDRRVGGHRGEGGGRYVPSGHRRRVDDDERPRGWRGVAYDPAHILTGTADACQATLLAMPLEVARPSRRYARPRVAREAVLLSAYLPEGSFLNGTRN